ncbi:MAG: biotin--[acetyl-CoA-carboxylase] ligase [Nocardioidaceae bacterium]|nr:biotin--[acetyl-CoA-carboxylase] ligase [Nocardioidaceae bacterium]
MSAGTSVPSPGLLSDGVLAASLTQGNLVPVSHATPSRPPLDLDALRSRLTGTPWRVEVSAESPSTNADVLARAGEEPGLELLSEHQTAGRGRLGRTWVTPARSALTFSVLVRAEVPLGRWPWLPLVTGSAVADALRGTAEVPATLKWPNDVLVGERKVAGILVELADTAAGPAAVVGVGLNTTLTQDELPVPTATSLALEGAATTDRTLLAAEVLLALVRHLDVWRAGGSPRAAYLGYAATVGRRVAVDLPGGARVEGHAVDVDDDGRLLVDDGTTVHALGAGDVVHVRAG